jgi:hypothetical protein
MATRFALRRNGEVHDIRVQKTSRWTRFSWRTEIMITDIRNMEYLINDAMHNAGHDTWISNDGVLVILPDGAKFRIVVQERK